MSLRQRSGVFANQRRGSRPRRSSSFAEPIVRNPPVATPATKVAISRKTTFHRLSPFMPTKNKLGTPKAIFFDAAGTLFYLTHSVGHHYALVGTEIGLQLDANQLDRAFVSAWNG